MSINLDSLCFRTSMGASALTTLAALAIAGCAHHAASSTEGATGTGGMGGSAATASGGGPTTTSGGPGGATATSSASSGGGATTSSGGGAASASTSTSTSTSTSSSSSGSVDVCGAASQKLAWTASIPATQATLGLVDVAVGPTNDVVVADTAGAATFEQHRWSSAGAVVSTHQDSSGTYTGPLFTSGLFIDPGNDAFYGMLLTGPKGTSTQVELVWTRLSAAGAISFMQTSTGMLAASAGAPSVSFFQVGGDATVNLHGAFLMGNPQYLQDGVYCYTSTGSNLGASAQNLTSNLTSRDFLWPSQDNGLILWEPLTATTNLGCSAPLTVPAAGGVALGKFTGAGSCTWNKLLALPTAALRQSNFRLGADGSMLAAVVYSGTVDFGGGPLTSAGTDSLALARFDSSGNLLWASTFGGAGSTFTVGSVGGSPSGDVVLTGGYAGTVDLGGGNLPSTADTFLAVFDSGGQWKWDRTVTVGGQGKLLAAAGKCGLVLATNSPSVNLGSGPLSTGQPASIGVAALAY